MSPIRVGAGLVEQKLGLLSHLFTCRLLSAPNIWFCVCVQLSMPFYYPTSHTSVYLQANVYIGDIPLAPILNPGASIAVLSWGPTPPDLDT